MAYHNHTRNDSRFITQIATARYLFAVSIIPVLKSCGIGKKTRFVFVGEAGAIPREQEASLS